MTNPRLRARALTASRGAAQPRGPPTVASAPTLTPRGAAPGQSHRFWRAQDHQEARARSIRADGSEEPAETGMSMEWLRLNQLDGRERFFSLGSPLIFEPDEFVGMCWTASQYAKKLFEPVLARIPPPNAGES